MNCDEASPFGNRREEVSPLAKFRGHGRPTVRAVQFFSALAVVTLSDAARASDGGEPRLPGEPSMMREPGEPVSVPDAADGDDPIDVDLALSYVLEIERADITRGRSDTIVADYVRVTSRLEPLLRVGLFHDLAFTARLSLALSDARRLSAVDGTSGRVPVSGDALFALPVKSPDRSGIDHLAFGILYAPLNQARDRALPNLMFGIETLLSLGQPIAACNRAATEGQVACAHFGDLDRDGVVDPNEPDGAGAVDAGYARASASIRARGVVSRRVRYVEPFGVLDAIVEIPLSNSPLALYSPDGGEGLPPVRATATLGLGVVPWENRERFSRVWLDVRAFGTFVSRGPDISPLFDALGSSDAAALRSAVSSAAGRAYETGVTVVDAHAELGASGAFAWRASSLIQLGVDVALRHEVEHGISEDDASSPAYRAAISADDTHFTQTGSLLFEIGAGGQVMF